MEKDNKWEWEQFCRLGEAIGDGMHYEDPWISKEYKRLSRILIPEIKEQEAENRRKRNESLNKQIKEKLIKDRCFKCESELKQVRSGSKVVQCTNKECNAKFRYKTKK